MRQMIGGGNQRQSGGDQPLVDNAGGCILDDTDVFWLGLICL